MATKTKRVRSRSFSTTEVTDRQINELLPRLDCLSDSDVIRRAVSFMYEKTFPDYIYNRSAVDVEKRKKMEQTVSIDSLSDLDYAEEFIGGGLHVDLGEGKEYYLVHTWGNFIFPIPLGDVRSYVAEDAKAIDYHSDKIAQGVSVSSKLDQYMVKYINKNHDIDLTKFIEENKSN